MTTSIRAARKAATRQLAIDTARKCWKEPGSYEAQGTREIAAEMGMSTGAIFANFTGKADLWRAAMGTEPPVDSAEVRAALPPAVGYEKEGASSVAAPDPTSGGDARGGQPPSLTAPHGG